MERFYNKEVIDAKFDAIHARFTDQDNKLDNISAQGKTTLEQAKLTNGSVAEVKAWQAFMKGGLAVLSVIVVPVVIYIINQLLK